MRFFVTFQTRNQQLCNSIVDLTNQHGQLEAREQELLTVIKLKVSLQMRRSSSHSAVHVHVQHHVQDKDLLDSSKHVAELNTRLKKLEVQNESSRRNEVESRRSAGEWKTKYQQCWKEYDYYKRETTDCTHSSLTRSQLTVWFLQTSSRARRECCRTQTTTSTRRDTMLPTSRRNSRSQVGLLLPRCCVPRIPTVLASFSRARAARHASAGSAAKQAGPERPGAAVDARSVRAAGARHLAAAAQLGRHERSAPQAAGTLPQQGVSYRSTCMRHWYFKYRTFLMAIFVVGTRCRARRRPSRYTEVRAR